MTGIEFVSHDPKDLSREVYDEDIHEAIHPYNECEYLEVHDKCCPHCLRPTLRLRGDTKTMVEQEYYTYAVAFCYDCANHVGTIKIPSQTMFGRDEDRAVLQGRPRVY
jgi:hypothetical protein